MTRCSPSSATEASLPGSNGVAVIEPGPDAPSPIRSPAGHALSYEETEQRLAPVLERVPITRVYDATPLDWLGLPVWSAVTPLALDLTVHAGKGPTAPAARISAVMEAIERVSAERVDVDRIRLASFAELDRERDGALDPELFDLPFETSYRADRPLAWIRGYDLVAGREVWVALDLVLSPAREGICTGVETNGLAAGNNRTEAVLHGLHEVIERDAHARDRFTRRYADDGERPPIRVVDRESVPAGAAALLRALRDRGLRAVIQDLSHELRVPVFRVTLYESSFPGREGRTTTFEGIGADLDPAWALSRAICEAVQSHTVMVVGARDTVEDGARHMRYDKGSFLRRLGTPTTSRPFPAESAELPDDLGARLRILLERVAAAGLHHCVAVDLTREDLGIPVVRVLVPGLSGPYGETSRRPALRLLRTLV
jgi:YcaO-like protein with predicted kinase domain